MNDDAIVITGVGALCSGGLTMDEAVSSLLSMKTSFQPPSFVSDVFSSRKIAPVAGFLPEKYISDAKILRFMSRETLMAASAAVICLQDSGIKVGATIGEYDIALFSGTGSSGLDFRDIGNMLDNSADDISGLFDAVKFGKTGINRLNPLTSFKILPNMPLAAVAMITGIKGSNLVFNPWEGNALLALTEAISEIKAGREKIVLCTGSDCKTHSDAFVALEEYGIFNDSDIVLSEGSACVAVEARASALERNAVINCVMKGLTNISLTSSGTCSYSYSEEIYTDCMSRVLAASDLVPHDIDLIISSNDMNKANDAAENSAIGKTFDSPIVLSPKKILGNAFAASGFISVAISAYILGKSIPVNGRTPSRILINSFSAGSEIFSIILEKA